MSKDKLGWKVTLGTISLGFGAGIIHPGLSLMLFGAALLLLDYAEFISDKSND